MTNSTGEPKLFGITFILNQGNCVPYQLNDRLKTIIYIDRSNGPQRTYLHNVI